MPRGLPNDAAIRGKQLALCTEKREDMGLFHLVRRPSNWRETLLSVVTWRAVCRFAEATLAWIALGMAVSAIILFFADRSGLVDWLALSRGILTPWAALLYPELIAKTTRLLAGVGLAYAVGVGLVSWILTRPRIHAVLGEGSVVVYHRLLGFAWAPVLASIYLLLHVDPDSLLVRFYLHGTAIIFSVPFLLSVIFFGSAATVVSPRPSRPILAEPFRSVAIFAPVIVGLGGVASLSDIFLPPAPSSFQNIVDGIVVQCTLLTVEVAFVLLVVEAGLADWRELQAVTGEGARVEAWPAARLLLRCAVFVLPVLTGIWLAVGDQLPAASRFMASNGSLMTVYHPYGKLRILDSATEISPWMYLAIDATEDPGVYSSPLTHAPLNPIRIASIFTAATDALGGSPDLSGGSGIATQSCKNFVGRSLADSADNLPGWVPGRRLMVMAATVVQKLVFEFPCGWAFERSARLLPLDRAPETFYLNEIYFGEGVYGIEAASYTYFGKPARDLTPAEAAMLAGLPQAPSAYNPWTNPNLVRARRHEVLQAMVREHYLSAADAQRIDEGPLGVLPRPLRYPDSNDTFISQGLVPWLAGQGYNSLSTSGLRVTTTIDPAEDARLRSTVARAVQELASQGANYGGAVELDPRNGDIQAWVGNVGIGPAANYGWDVVNQVPVEPGGTIQPLLYACALRAGTLRTDAALDDTQRVIGGQYIANRDGKSLGEISPRAALAQSRRVEAALLINQLTPVGFVNCLRDRFAVQADLQPQLNGVRLSLGVAAMPMLELAQAYTPLATGGTFHPARPVKEIDSATGQTLYLAPTSGTNRVLSCPVATWIGGTLSRVSGQLGVPRNLATKTGTTETSSYAVGYGSQVILAAWIGTLSADGVPRSIVDAAGVQKFWGEQGGAVVWKAVAQRHYGSLGAPLLATCGG